MMLKEFVQPETIEFLGLLVPAFLALTERQRKAIRNRDHNKCNLPADHHCGGRLEVHHILPQGYLGHLNVDPDFPENVLTICHNAHVGDLDAIHPDMAEALQNYHIDPKAIERVREQREELMAQREIYWNPKWDRIMSVVAVKNTQEAKKKGWFFPENGHDKR